MLNQVNVFQVGCSVCGDPAQTAMYNFNPRYSISGKFKSLRHLSASMIITFHTHLQVATSDPFVRGCQIVIGEWSEKDAFKNQVLKDHSGG